jgi:hypothetical protein
VRHGEEGELIVGGRHRDHEGLPAQRSSLGRQRLSGHDRIEDDRGRRAPEVGCAQRVEASEWPGRTVQASEHRLALFARERDPSDALGGLEHLERDARRVLGDGGERAGHEREGAGRRREALEEAAAVEGEAGFVHTGLTASVDHHGHLPKIQMTIMTRGDV